MGGELTIALAVFLASAVLVMFCGAKLAVYGDALASLTGLGRLFVGSLLVALATSLPELSTHRYRKWTRNCQNRTSPKSLISIGSTQKP